VNNNGLINEIAGFATLAICIMTAISFTYTDGTTGSVKGISNNYWSTMSIQDDGSSPISVIQYCINVKIPTSDTFDTRGYRCSISIGQDGIDFYQTSFTIISSVDVEANSWTRIITVPLEIQSISSDWDNGIYTVSFENVGTIEGIGVPKERYIDISIDDGIVTFMM
jgi:hypothetical protein